MNHNKMQQVNKIAIFEAISRGIDTISALSQLLELSHNTIEALCSQLIDENLIYSFETTSGSCGRPTIKYSIVKSHFCAYIEESKCKFSCILVDASSNAIERINKLKSKEVERSLILSRFVRDIKEFDAGRNLCRGIFIDCTNTTASLLTKDFTRIKLEEFIASSMKNDKEIILFVFDRLCVMSVYGRISSTLATQGELERALTFDKVYKFNEPYYEELFSALSLATIEEMKKTI